MYQFFSGPHATLSGWLQLSRVGPKRILFATDGFLLAQIYKSL